MTHATQNDQSQMVTVQDLLGRPLNEVESKNSPSRLFAAGDTGLLRFAPRISIVGSRKASRQGLATAAALSAALSDYGATIVSGLAEGIDTAAHTAAVDSDGRTVAVLGTPLGEFFPKQNRGLQLRLMSEQLVLSQFPARQRTFPGNFPMRNRTMALLSDATIIAEAAEKSGSLHQGWEALRLGRPLFIMESAVENTALHWPAEFLKYGATVISVEALDSLIDSLPSNAHTGFPAFAF